MKSPEVTFGGIPIVFDDNVPRGVMLVDTPHGLEIFSVPLNPPPAGSAGKQEKDQEP